MGLEAEQTTVRVAADCIRIILLLLVPVQASSIQRHRRCFHAVALGHCILLLTSNVLIGLCQIEAIRHQSVRLLIVGLRVLCTVDRSEHCFGSVH